MKSGNSAVKCEAALLPVSKEVNVCLLRPKYVGFPFVQYTHPHALVLLQDVYAEVLHQRQCSCIACSESPLKLWIGGL